VSHPQPENRLLSSLPPAEFARLTAGMTDVTFALKDVLYRSGGGIDHVYFPRSGVLSFLLVMLDGAAAEVATVGFEGMAGAALFLGEDRSPEEVVCQVAPSLCRRMRGADFVAEVDKAGPFRDAVRWFARADRAVTARLSACNALHGVEERCARWLLMTRDRVGADEFGLTQEFLAIMLGVRRPAVTVAAGALQTAGLITYRHGKVRVADPERLEEAACECYPAVRAAFARPIS
jgi:CRP-like cAMP-binding protein